MPSGRPGRADGRCAHPCSKAKDPNYLRLPCSKHEAHTVLAERGTCISRSARAPGPPPPPPCRALTGRLTRLLQVVVRAVAAEQATSSAVGQPYERVLNFSAGPAVLPVEVLEQAQADLLSWQGSGEELPISRN
jgi:hypothetical protein